MAEKPSNVEVGNKFYVSNMELHPVAGLLSLAKSPIHIDNLRHKLHGKINWIFAEGDNPHYFIL